jgi:hypothetical protein
MLHHKVPMMVPMSARALLSLMLLCWASVQTIATTAESKVLDGVYVSHLSLPEATIDTTSKGTLLLFAHFRLQFLCGAFFSSHELAVMVVAQQVCTITWTPPHGIQRRAIALDLFWE